MAIPTSRKSPCWAIFGLLPVVLPSGASATIARSVLEIAPGNGDSDDVRVADALQQASRFLARSRPVTLRFRQGTYRFRRPIILGEALSGTARAPFRIVGVGKVFFTGAIRLQRAGVTASAALLAQLPGASRRHAAAYVIPRDMLRIVAAEDGRSSQSQPRSASIWVQQGVAPLVESHWPNTGYRLFRFAPPQTALQTSRVGRLFDRILTYVRPATAPSSTLSVHVSRERATLWRKASVLWASGYWSYDWLHETLRVRSVDPATGNLILSRPGAILPEAAVVRYRILNSANDIDTPGEFAYDAGLGALAAWPRVTDRPIEMAAVNDLMSIDDAHDISIEGIALTGARGSALVVSRSDRIRFADGFIGGVGGVGARIVDGHDNSIIRTVIADTGEGGVTFGGGDFGSLSAGRNSVVNCVITRFGGLTRTYRPGLRLDGVGQIAAGNLIFDGPHAAIIFQGNEHRITGNEIASVDLESGDAGAIYSGRDLTARGTMIEGNYVHDVVRPANLTSEDASTAVRGVYLDDYASGIAVRSNLFVRVSWPIWMNGGSANIIAGNIFVRSSTDAIQLRDTSLLWGLGVGDVARRSVARLNPAMSARYGVTAKALRADGGNARGNRIGTNWLLDSGGVAITPGIRSRQLVAPQMSLRGIHAPGGADFAALSRFLLSANPAISGFVRPSLDRRAALSDLRYRALEARGK